MRRAIPFVCVRLRLQGYFLVSPFHKPPGQQYRNVATPSVDSCSMCHFRLVTSNFLTLYPFNEIGSILLPHPCSVCPASLPPSHLLCLLHLPVSPLCSSHFSTSLRVSLLPAFLHALLPIPSCMLCLSLLHGFFLYLFLSPSHRPSSLPSACSVSPSPCRVPSCLLCICLIPCYADERCGW